MNNSDFKIRKAQIRDTTLLTKIAIRSKALWGYGSDFIEQCRAELTVTPEFVQENICYCVSSKNIIAGFYSLVKLNQSDVELDHFFIDPKFTAKGFGKVLLEHAIKTARKEGYKNLIIQSDPNAVEFYKRQGAIQIGEKESLSIKGRMLPLLKIEL